MSRAKTHTSLFANKVDNKVHKQIDKIVDATGVPKWMVIDKLLSSALGVKTTNSLDLSKYLKGCK